MTTHIATKFPTASQWDRLSPFDKADIALNLVVEATLEAGDEHATDRLRSAMWYAQDAIGGMNSQSLDQSHAATAGAIERQAQNLADSINAPGVVDAFTMDDRLALRQIENQARLMRRAAERSSK